MESAKRPGGLTAIGILCIVLALVGMLAGMALKLAHGSADHDELTREFERASAQQRADSDASAAEKALNERIVRSMADRMRSASPQAFRAMFAAGMAGGLLMVVAGIGLLGRRRLLGYHAALASGVAVVACGVIAVTQLGFLDWGFPMLGAVWAVVMMLLVHIMYRPLLTR